MSFRTAEFAWPGPEGEYARSMKSFHEGQLVTVVGESEELEGIVVHALGLVKVEIAVPEAERGAVFRSVHPKFLRERKRPGEHDEALRRVIRRGRAGSQSGRPVGHGSSGHSRPTAHRTTGK
jgi:hypothetical protein